MRPRGSITGPLIIIAIGVLFLLHAISPDFPILDFIGQYWPYVLIAWGVIALFEVGVRAFGGSTVPMTGVSPGAWFVVVLICLIGLASFEFRRQDAWWGHTDWGRGFNTAFGDERDYAVASIQKSTGGTPHLIIEDFRGDAKVSGGQGDTVTVAGHKVIRAMKASVAEQADAQTPVEVIQEGNNVIIRCNQGRARGRTSVTTNLEITAPKGASLEASGSLGDFDVTMLNGGIAIRSDNAGVRVQDAGGNVSVETRRSDLVRCTNVAGSVDLRGHGSDLELTRVEGQVNVSGDYSGTVILRQVRKPVRIENSRTQLQVAQIPGEVRLDRGSLNVQGAAGPLRLTAHSTDVSMEDFSNGIDISVDRGDIELKPGRVPLSKMAVHAGSGNIELAMPQTANFALMATTNSGEIQNDYGDGLKEETAGKGGRLEGTIGNGPEVTLTTGRGTITVRKSGESTPAAPADSEDLQARPNLRKISAIAVQQQFSQAALTER